VQKNGEQMKENSTITKEASMNPQISYVQAALQIQRWRDFGSQVFAYGIGSIVFIVIWAAQGRGFFWPIYPLLIWGLGLSFQHFNVVIHGQITDEDVRRTLNRNKGDTQP
jgi:hypothetical protein